MLFKNQKQQNKPNQFLKREIDRLTLPLSTNQAFLNS